MKSTSTQTASGIQFAMSFYDIKEGEKPKQVVDSALADLENSVQRMMNYSCDGRFNSIETKPEQLFKNKEKLDMVLGYFYDNYIQFDGACIVQAQFKSDIQLFSFLDFFFNNCTRFARTPLQRYQPIEQIPFTVHQAADNPSVYRLMTGAEHPTLLINERYFIFVGEKSAA